MNADDAKKLRESFPAEMIGKLPRVICKACSENKAQKHCPEHQRTKCATCGNYITTAHIHLDYIGHAATTDRLLQVDPAWTWEPLGVNTEGNPAIVSGIGEANEPVGLWIKLTVCGVTRPGFGSGKSAKEAISDAIRNAAMRFGVALDLWAKEDLQSAAEPGSGGTGASSEAATASEAEQSASSAAELNFAEQARLAQEARAQRKATKTQIAKIDALIGKAAATRKVSDEDARAAIENDYGPIADLTQDKATELAGKLERWAAAVTA